MFEAAGRFLDNIAGTGRVLLVLDDLQWAGAEAARAARLPGAPGLGAGAGGQRAAGSARCAPGSPIGQCAAELARLRLVRGRRLAALGALEADALVAVGGGADRAHRGRAGPDRAARRAACRCSWSSWPGTVPVTRCRGTCRLAVVHQLAALPEPVSAPLGRVAVIGGTVPVDRLPRPDVPVELVLDQLDVARRYRVLDETRAGFRFRYPLVREVLAGGLGPARRRLWRAIEHPPAPQRTYGMRRSGRRSTGTGCGRVSTRRRRRPGIIADSSASR